MATLIPFIVHVLSASVVEFHDTFDNVSDNERKMSMKERPGFRDWFGEGAFVNSDGRPTVFYHGTDTGADFNIFARTDEASIGFHFGDIATAECRIDLMTSSEGEGAWGAVIPVVCNARNPLRLTDHHTWVVRNVCGELYDLGIVNDEQHDLICESCSEYSLFAAIEMAGYDSVIYSNETENTGTPSDSLIVWRADMVKGAYAGSYDRNSPGLLPGIPHNAEDMECWESVAVELAEWRSELDELATPAPTVAVIPVF